jgi:hypothetical protein
MTSLDMEALVTSLDMFVHQENPALFKKLLADPETTDAERELLLKLLAEEEAKDVRDADGHRPIPSEVRTFLHSQDG